MGVLAYPTALAVVQESLLDFLALGLRRRDPAVADLAALAAVPSRGASGSTAVPDRALRYVASAAACYVFRTYSTAAAGAGVVVPADAAGGAGRWLLATSPVLDSSGIALSSVQQGYLRGVLLYAGERSDKEWDQRILGVRPCVVLQFTGETRTNRANQRGALTEKTYHFSVWGVSRNLRAGAEAERGSPVAADAADDPGVARLLGDLEYLLDGRTGADLGVDGVDYLLVGAQQPAVEDLAHREFLWIMSLDVRATLGREDPPTRYLLETAYAQPHDVQLRGQAWDPDNYVVSGLAVALGPGLDRAPGDGEAVVGGAQVVTSGSPARPFAPSSWTWRDLNPDGSWTYSTSASDDYPPPATPGALRVGATRADASGLVEDRILAPSSTPVGPEDQVLPPTT